MFHARLCFTIMLGIVTLTAPVLGQTTITFENPTLAQPLVGQNAFQNGATLSPAGSFTISSATFNNNYDPEFGSWSGWSYSNVTNLDTPGFGNQYAAYSVSGGGTGAGGSANYGVAFGFTGNPSTIGLPVGSRPTSIDITNTTYAALSMLNGDAFAKKFGGTSGDDADFFLLTISGTDAQNQSTGTVDFYLADYRSSNNALDYIVQNWTTVDLSSLGSNTAQLSFSLDSSDVGAFGINTPTYFAADNIVFTPVPEPMSIGLVAAIGCAIGLRVRRRKGNIAVENPS